MRTELVALLAGVPVDDPAEADYLEVREYDDEGRLVATTYAGAIVDAPEDATALPVGLAPQGEAEDADLAGVGPGWGVLNPDGSPASTLDELLDATGLRRLEEADWLGRLLNLTASPAWEAAPAGLRSEVEALFAE